ncbi:hypothetical protein RUM44_010611 [Polyplax serrata]|uniref:Uncharacterized protein n=1 Tax=Polyplax serrata TaxID=468196 RepID=A0ABR1AW07_POLSC
MSHTLTELLEVNSYWQKAVEDAIYDTLKGENRLYYALRHHKKIKDKLEKLGYKPMKFEMSSRQKSRLSVQSFLSIAENVNIDGYTSDTEWDSCEEQSTGSNKDIYAQEMANSERPSPAGSNTKSQERKETPPEKIYRSPERPILGNGSLEKMKKSQNSFCCEPMGTESRAKSAEMKTQKEESTEARCRTFLDDRMKNVECLHFRQHSYKPFGDSDSEITSKDTAKQRSNMTVNKQGEEVRGGSLKQKVPQGHTNPTAETQPKESKIPMTLDPGEDLFWEREVKKAIKENASQERKLYFAFAKREIVNGLQKGKTKDTKEIKIKISRANLVAKRRQSKKVLSPFVKFYLEVYRELCHRCPVKEIGAKAAAKWWQKSLKERSKNQK